MANHTLVGKDTAQPDPKAEQVARVVPELSADHVAALESVRSNDVFTLEKSAALYADVTRLRPKK